MDKKILIIEDTIELANIIERNLLEEGFEVVIENFGDKALEVFYKESPDLVLLDINLPNKNGFEICKEIRKMSQTPIIIITARDTEKEEILGLEAGATDYVTKPFSPKLIAIKVKKILKMEGDTFFRIGDKITFDYKTFILTVDGEQEELSRREAEALEYFLTHKNTILNRETLLNEVWGFDFFGDERTVDTLIKRLRKKLGIYGEFIKTIRGVGYVFSEKNS